MATAPDPKTTRAPSGPGSERTFGIVFAILFVIIGCRPLLGGAAPVWWSIALAAAFAIAAVVAPNLLRPLNWLWYRLGILLHHVMSPLIMGAIFFLCVTPIALFMRLAGKDVLGLRLRRDVATYWHRRETPASAPESMKRQF
jgi:hypothetical protein